MTVDIDLLSKIFDEQYGNLPTGGFYNPVIESEDDEEIEFRCSYDNYDNEDDCWHWYYNKKTAQFFN